jgi:hypothetical protein
LSCILDGERLQTVSLGTGLGGFIRARMTPKGFVLTGRGDEIEFAIEVDEARYSQLSVSRKNIAYCLHSQLTQFELHLNVEKYQFHDVAQQFFRSISSKCLKLN